MKRNKGLYIYSQVREKSEEFTENPNQTLKEYLLDAVDYFKERSRREGISAKTKKSYRQMAANILKDVRIGNKKLGPSLESRAKAAAGIIGIASLIVSLFFFSEGITGNIIGVSSTNYNIIGAVLFIIGLIGVYFSVKR